MSKATARVSSRSNARANAIKHFRGQEAGSGIRLRFDGPNADNDPNNEIQDLNLSGNQLSITGGSTVNLPTGADDLATPNAVEAGYLEAGSNTTGNVLANDTDADGGVLAIGSVAALTTLGATVSLNEDGSVKRTL